MKVSTVYKINHWKYLVPGTRQGYKKDAFGTLQTHTRGIQTKCTTIPASQICPQNVDTLILYMYVEF
jgi:hypothetical protein